MNTSDDFDYDCTPCYMCNVREAKYRVYIKDIESYVDLCRYCCNILDGGKMKLELTIADDKELRAFIKDQIKGMVLNVAREEIISIISKAANEKQLASKDFLTKIIQELIHNQFSGQYNFRSMVKNLIQEEVRAVIKEVIESGNIKALL